MGMGIKGLKAKIERKDFVRSSNKKSKVGLAFKKFGKIFKVKKHE